MSVLVSRESGEADIGITLADGRPPGLNWNYDRTELLADALVHTTGIGLALAGIVHLAITACALPTALERAAFWIYGLALLTMFGISAAYNLWPVSPRKWLLRRFDQSAIYLMIAAGYTPFFVQARSETVSIVLLVSLWLAASAGGVLKLVSPARCDRLSVLLYLLLGWAGALALTSAGSLLPGSTLRLIAAGGVMYSAGVVFHLCERLRYQNAIWHGFVLAGAVCHYSAVVACLPAAVAG